MDSIPIDVFPEIYEKARFQNEKFMAVQSNEQLDVRMQYPILGMKNAEGDCLMREEVYERLKVAQGFLPTGYKLRIWDAWRPFALQNELYESYAENIVRKFHIEGESEENKLRIIHRYVSNPVENRDIPPVHTTGGAVDVTILDECGNELNMGTRFDEFSDKTQTAYYENGSDDHIRDNRRLLYNIMKKAGFTNIPSEWWHYDYGDRFWSFYTGRLTKYRGVFTKGEIDVKR